MPRGGTAKYDEYGLPLVDDGDGDGGGSKLYSGRLPVLVCLGLDISLWIAEAEIIQALQSRAHHKFSKPFFIVYMVMSARIALLPFVWLGYTMERNVSAIAHTQSNHPEGWIWSYVLRMIVFTLLNFLGTFIWYISLPISNVAANSAIFESSCAFIFVFSVLFLNERITAAKVCLVAVCLSGTVIVIFKGSDSGTSSNSLGTVMGNVYCLLAAGMYGFFRVMFIRFGNPMPEGARPSPFHSLLFTCMLGVMTAATMWPGFFILDHYGIETFIWPEKIQWTALLWTCALDGIMSVVSLTGATLSSPLLYSLGQQMVVPTSVVADWVFHSYSPPLAFYLGTIGIVLGFSGFSVLDELHLDSAEYEDIP